MKGIDVTESSAGPGLIVIAPEANGIRVFSLDWLMQHNLPHRGLAPGGIRFVVPAAEYERAAPLLADLPVSEWRVQT